jgi:integrase
MPYQFKREPLTQDEANRLAQACSSHQEKLVVLTLLDTGLRVSELAEMTKENLRLANAPTDDLWKRWSIRHKIKAPHHSPIASRPAAARRTLGTAR